MKRILKKHSIILIVLFILIIFTYWNLQKTFYQQDEWQTLGNNVVYGWKVIAYNLSLPQILFAEGRILTRLFYYVFLGVYQYNVVPVYLFALVFHTLNAWLVYCIVRKFKTSNVISFAAAAFFGVNSVSAETTIWISAICTIPATTLLLVSILSYLNFLETGNVHKRNWSFILGILSLFFKETGIIIFIFYPLLYVAWNKTKNLKHVFLVHAPLLLYGASLIIFRIAQVFLAPKGNTGFIDNRQGTFLITVLYHCIVFPLTSLFQIFAPARYVYSVADRIIRSEYTFLVTTPLLGMAGQSAISDMVSLLGTVVLSIVIGVMTVFQKKEEKSKLVFFGVALLVLSFFPYAILHKYFSYFSGRYYYVGVIGGACIFGYLLSWISKRTSKVGRGLLFIGVCYYFSYHIQEIHRDIYRQMEIARERKIFLSEIYKSHPTIENKTVFYIISDKKYLGEITYPFQNGLGYILEVLYYNTGKIPKDFLRDFFLWDLGEEGYRTTGVYGFGYFEHLDKLGEMIARGNVTPSIVYGYRYDSEARKMSDITLTVREQLATFSGELR